MPDEWRPQNAPNVKQDFNEAARQQVKQTNLPSEQGISSTFEIDQRTEQERIIRERLQRENAPKLEPKNEIAKKLKEEQFNKDNAALEEHTTVKEKIWLRLEEKKKEEMNREFNRVANPSRD